MGSKLQSNLDGLERIASIKEGGYFKIHYGLQRKLQLTTLMNIAKNISIIKIKCNLKFS